MHVTNSLKARLSVRTGGTKLSTMHVLNVSWLYSTDLCETEDRVPFLIWLLERRYFIFGIKQLVLGMTFNVPRKSGV